ncbi:MAG: AAA family ATPase [Anaerolineae bacterium]|nr:AAA family ATPase [Anaerolineae bacterium]
MSSLAMPHADSSAQPPVSFGAWLQRQRKAMRLSAEALAQTIYCSAVTLRKIEYEERLPSKDMAERMAEVFHIAEAKRARFIEFARGNTLAYDAAFEVAIEAAPVIALTPPTSPSAATLFHLPHNLPTPVTSFIGRHGEAEQVAAHLSEARLITLTGAGGAGKTRLALQTANHLLELQTQTANGWLAQTYPDGVWLVGLAALTDERLVLGAVASALGVYEDNTRALAALRQYIGQKKLVLVLDNCEHLVAACAELVTNLLHTCPHLKILATSREVLGVMGEVRYGVQPLSLPTPNEAGHIALATHAPLPDALQLFAARAKAVQHQFTLSPTNAALVTHICQQLDGNPLAIELAAARLNALSLAQIAARLDDRFKLLTNGNRAGPPHQQTLRATLEWSCGLLSADERHAFAQLAVFAGGWTLEAAEAVLGEEVLDVLTRLVDKSLVTVNPIEHGGQTEWRYGYLETIRQYAHEQFVHSAAFAHTHRRHLAWLAEWCAHSARRLVGPDQVRWYARINREFDNIRAAVHWAMPQQPVPNLDDMSAAIHMLLSLDRYWNTHHHAEGQRWLTQALQQRDHLPPKLVGKILERAALLAAFQGQNEQSARYADDAIHTLRPLGDKASLSWALRHASACKLNALDLAGFFPLSHEAKTLFEELGDQFGMAMINTDMATAAMLQQRFTEAQTLLEASLDTIREHGDITRLLYMLGTAYAMSGDQARAEKYIKDSLRMGWQIEYRYAICHSFFWLARVSWRFGQPERAAQLLGVHQMAQERYGLVVLPVIQHYLLPTVQALHTQLGESAYATHFAHGYTMPLSHAVGWVLG